jgi:hypothetical protein
MTRNESAIRPGSQRYGTRVIKRQTRIESMGRIVHGYTPAELVPSLHINDLRDFMPVLYPSTRWPSLRWGA